MKLKGIATLSSTIASDGKILFTLLESLLIFLIFFDQNEMEEYSLIYQRTTLTGSR